MELALKPLPRTFYARDAVILARALVGTYLVHGDKVARIVETEAYCGPSDLACHARAGLTKRTRALLGEPAHAYVFLVYGMHECFNVVGGAEGRGHAVLIRAVDPVANVDAKTSGPGLLTRALGITRAHDGASLLGTELYVAARTKRPRITIRKRIGVEYAGLWARKPWRFYDPASSCVSKR